MTAPEIAAAKTLCRSCPVRGECLASGMDQEWGVWGGYTRAERERAVARVMDQMEVPEDQRKSTVRREQAYDVVVRAYETGHLDVLVAISKP